MKPTLVRSSTTTIGFGLCLAALVAAGCDRTPGPPAPRLTLSPDSAVLAVRGSVSLSATVTGTTDSVVNYSSTDTSVVRVDHDAGTVRAVGYGSAWVTGWVAAQPSLRDSVRVRVPEPAGPWLLLLSDTLTVYLGGSAQLTWRVGNVSAPAPAVVFTSSDTSVLEARPGGLLCPRMLGDASVRASLLSYPTAADSARVRVLQPYWVDAPPMISVHSVTDTAGKAVDLGAVRGAIRVTVLVDTPSRSPCLPPPEAELVTELSFDGKLWQRGPGFSWGGQYTYTFVVDTRATDAAGHPLLPNGSHTMTTQVRNGAGMLLMSASLAMVVAN